MIRLKLPTNTQQGASTASNCIKQLTDYIESASPPKSTELKSLEQQLTQLYSTYFSKSSDLGKLAPAFPKGTATYDRLFGCYESGSGIDREIMNSVRSSFTGYCPYCSARMPTKPKGRSPDRDHFLPRSIFPEYAILSANLVICCDDCNDAKNDTYKTGNSEQAFLHPYFDDAPLSTTCFDATVGIQNNTIQFEFALRDINLPPELQERLVSHITKLDLLSRMSEEAATHTSELLYAPEESPEQLALRLAGLANSIIGERPNSPIGLGLRALALSPLLDTARWIVTLSHVRICLAQLE